MKNVVRRIRAQLSRVVPKQVGWLRYGLVLLCLLALVLLTTGLTQGVQTDLLVGWLLIALIVILLVREAYTQGWAWTGFVPSSHPSKDKANDAQQVACGSRNSNKYRLTEQTRHSIRLI